MVGNMPAESERSIIVGRGTACQPAPDGSAPFWRKTTMKAALTSENRGHTGPKVRACFAPRGGLEWLGLTLAGRACRRASPSLDPFRNRTPPAHPETIFMLARREIFPHVLEMNHQARRRLGCCVYLVFDESEWLLIDIGYEDTVTEIVDM